MSGSSNDEVQHQDQEQNIDHDAWIIKLRRPIRREGSVQYMVFVLVSFIVTVSLTRLSLSLSGYPMLGGGELHIAHVLWGGLLLFVGTLLLLLFSNRQVFKTSAILAGTGIGLFIDEVGKFITLKNDYFYPGAAPIIYIFFMLLLILLIRLRRQMKSTPRSEFNRALETLQDWVDHPLSRKEQALLVERLKDASSSADPHLASLAGPILNVVQLDLRPAPFEQPPRLEIYIKKLDRWVSERGLRLGLAIGFMIMAVMAFKNPASGLLESHLPGFWGSFLFGVHSGRWLGSESAPGLYQARVTLEVVLGILLFVTGLLLFYKQARLAVPLGFGLLIFYLATIDMLLFFFEQFSTITFVIFQYLLLIGVIYYRSRFLPNKKSDQ
ncbi:MAG: hypothetical protein A2W36_01185 [Chloroflexi bacterium RBG_16_58_14]|nr:MAG: hypothetical protein A2W36_01185 [Chloroflexi bacterium RBG_16_58_14]